MEAEAMPRNKKADTRSGEQPTPQKRVRLLASGNIVQCVFCLKEKNISVANDIEQWGALVSQFADEHAGCK